MNNETHGLMSPEEIAARQELRQRVQERQEIMARQDAALKEYRTAHSPASPTSHLLAVALVCFLSAGLVMALWSILLGFVLAILAACVIARAAWGEG